MGKGFSWPLQRFMHFVKVGKRSLNLDNVTHCEIQAWQDTTSVKIFFIGSAHNTPLVLNEEEAKEFSKYLDYIAERPV